MVSDIALSKHWNNFGAHAVLKCSQLSKESQQDVLNEKADDRVAQWLVCWPLKHPALFAAAQSVSINADRPTV